jgi:molybdopterin/thiamine biosynthesis adenylyltransferase
MKTRFQFRMDDEMFRELRDHLFPGDHDEHGAVIAVGICRTGAVTRFLARKLFLAKDGVDYVPGKHGYRALTARYVAEVADYCADRGLGYFAVHPHGSSDEVSFSPPDLQSHQRGYPALVDLLGGQPMGALVFGTNVVAGSVWTKSGVFDLESFTVVGPAITRMVRKIVPKTGQTLDRYDRQSRLFGDRGQEVLSGLKIVIVGVGGIGSVLSETLSKLGVGEILAIDFDKVEPPNLSRIPGATDWDAMTKLVASKVGWIKRLGTRLARYKVDVAKRVATAANPRIRYHAVRGSILDRHTAELMRDADFIFLAADPFQARLVFNNLVHQYLIPGIQFGAKVRTDKETGNVTEIYSVTRTVLPRAGGGCLSCNGWIPPSRLADEAQTEEQRKAQKYVEDDQVVAPSVITLNAMAAAQGSNDFLMMIYGLLSEGVKLESQRYLFSDRSLETFGIRNLPNCLVCSSHEKSVWAKGDKATLPCRQPQKPR